MITSSPEQSTSNPSASLISSSGPLATVVAACLAGAGLIHLAFAPGHLPRGGGTTWREADAAWDLKVVSASFGYLIKDSVA